jgi:GT2 family glycosyltransferase
MEGKQIGMATESSPLVSFVSLTYNRKDRIAALLRAVQEQTYQPVEYIVVDNASTDGTSELIAAQFPQVRLVRSLQNTGTFAYDLGVKAARGKYLLVMDDDGLPASRTWIGDVVEHFQANDRLGAVSCTVRMQDTGRIAHDSPQFVPTGDSVDGYPCVAYNGTGAGLRAAAVRSLDSIYPCIYFRSWIELHLCTNLLRSGWQVRHFPEIEVWHCRPSGSSIPVVSYYGLRNYYWYVSQFYPWPALTSAVIRHFGTGLKFVSGRKTPMRVFLRASRDALVALPRVAAGRTPISAQLLGHLKWVRRHGNWHGIAPEVLQFTGQ